LGRRKKKSNKVLTQHFGGGKRRKTLERGKEQLKKSFKDEGQRSGNRNAGGTLRLKGKLYTI